MSDEVDLDVRSIPLAALDDEGRLLGPAEIPLAALIEPREIMPFVDSVAELTQMECSTILYEPGHPQPLLPDGEIQIVRSPICTALNAVRAGETCRCVKDVHAAAHAAMESGKPARADCVGGEGTLFACPMILCHADARYPKAAIVAAATDIYHFHYADRLAAIMGRPVAEAEDLMCQTDKRCLNAAQLRRLRTIMDSQTQSFSRQISDRYAQLESLAMILDQQQQLTEAYGQLDNEFRAVGRIQRSLVPSEEPAIGGFAIATHYEPAHLAGGDYYDFFDGQDGRWGVLIADVSGHGPAAAVAMAMMRAVLHSCIDDPSSPEAVLASANRHLQDNLMSDQFVTALFAVLDHESRRMTFAGAGHELPLLFDSAKQEVRQLPMTPSLPLGVGSETTFRSNEIALATGDVVLLYTDGITDRLNAARERFGGARLCQVLQASAPSGATGVRDAIIDSVKTFASGTPPPDDQTLVVLECV